MTLYEKLEPWFALKSVPGIGNYLFKRLMDRFGSPRRVFQAPAGELAQVIGITARLVSNIRRHRLPAEVRGDLKPPLNAATVSSRSLMPITPNCCVISKTRPLICT